MFAKLGRFDMDTIDKDIVYNTSFGYVFTKAKGITKNNIYLDAWRVFGTTYLKVGRLHLGIANKKWVLGISLGAAFVPPPKQILNITAWANKHITNKPNKLWEKLK